MPIFEYQCNECGEIFEQLVFTSECQDGFCCPTCGDEDTCRLMSSFSCGSGDSGTQSSGLSSGCSHSHGGFS